MRMYHLVMYNLSGIQKGIQAGHSALEYVREHGNTKKYKDFIENHKTFILLDGGGSMEMGKHLAQLKFLDVRHSHFVEPDLNNSISAITFLVDERIYAGVVIPDEYDEDRVFYDDGFTPMNFHDGELFNFIKQFNLAKN